MSKLAKDELFEGRYVPLDEVLRHIDQVSRDHVLRLAHELIDPNRLSLTALGPVSPRALSTCFDRTPRGRSR
jgi:predicted Zn-dependent peptidase